MNKNKIAFLFKNLIIYIILGVICGVLGTFFAKTISLVTLLRHENRWLLYFLPLAGVISVKIYKLLKVSGMGTDQVLEATEDGAKISYKLVPAIFLASTLSHLCGASVGREGAAIQLGGGTSKFFGKIFKLSENEEKILIYCGMAGVFSSVFGTPFAATFFALEVVVAGSIFFKGLIPAFITSIVSFCVAFLLGAHSERFYLSVVPEISFSVMWKLLVLCAFTALLGIAFCFGLKYSKKLFEKAFKNSFVRIAVGGIAIVILTFLVNSYDYNGAGVDVIERIFNENEFVPWAFLLKILFTIIAVGTGFKGGEIVPTLFIGATFGAFVGTLLGIPIAFSAAIGMIVLFCAVTNCPLASVMLAVELFSGKGIIYVIFAVVICYCISGKISLYPSQKAKGLKKLF